MLRHLGPLVPGERLTQLFWQARHRSRDGTAHGFGAMAGKGRAILGAAAGLVAFHAWQMQQHGEARGPFDKRADCRAAEPEDEIAFPVPGHGPVTNFGRSLTDNDLVADK